MISTPIVFLGQNAVLTCDAKCSKAWGINSRPKQHLSENPDDYEFLSDSELGDAPIDPQIYEGGHAKPRIKAERHNQWCARECERSRIAKKTEDYNLPDFDKRLPNIPESYNAIFDRIKVLNLDDEDQKSRL